MLLTDGSEDNLPKLMMATGWSLGDVYGVLIADPKVADRWLASAGDAGSAPMLELASVYEREGQPGDARWLRYRAAVHVTRRTRGWAAKLGRRCYGALVGHGYYPLRALAWLLVVLLAIGILSYAKASEFSTAITATIRADLETRATGPTDMTDPPIPSPIPGRAVAAWCVPEWDIPCFEPGLYTLITTLPAAGNARDSERSFWKRLGRVSIPPPRGLDPDSNVRRRDYWIASQDLSYLIGPWRRQLSWAPTRHPADP